MLTNISAMTSEKSEHFFLSLEVLYCLCDDVVCVHPLTQILMPLGSIQEWRARIGSSWCALGRPLRSVLSHRTGRPKRQQSGWKLPAYSQYQSVSMVTVLPCMLLGPGLGMKDFEFEEFLPTGLFLSECQFMTQWHQCGVFLFFYHACRFASAL